MAKKALLIGVSQYEAGLPSLAAAPKDVAAMLRVLKNPELGGFDDVQTLLDPDLEAMQTAIDRLFQSCQKGDLGLLYFSGHGITDDSDRLYLATRRTSKDTFRSNAVAASFIQGIMRDRSYQRQHVLILDCCYSGAFAEGWLAKSVDINLKPQLEVEGSVVLTSSTSTQKSYEDKEGELSIYTNYIVQGIESGAAESDGDGMISADELHEYAKRHVQSAKPTMKPEIYGIRQGIKILVSKARTNMKLDYRRLVERYVDNAEISIVGQKILDLKRELWGISDDVADAIENEVVEPHRKHLENLELYQTTLEKAVQDQFPLTEKICEHLKDLQEVLGLGDKDVTSIQNRVITAYARKEAERCLSSGDMMLLFGDKHRAISLYNKAIQLRPRNLIAYIKRGEAKSALGDKQSAISDYDQAIKLNPEYTDSYFSRGEAKSALGDKQGAIADYDQAIKLNPKKSDTYFSRAIVKSDLQDSKGAIIDYDKYILIEPDDPNAYYNRGNQKAVLEDNQGALEDFQQAARLYEQQDQMDDYLDAQNRIKELGG